MCVLKIIILDTSLIEIKTWVHKRPVSECLQQLNLQWQKAWSNPDILQWVNRQSVVHPVVEPTLQPTGTNYTTTQMDSWRIMLGEEATPRGYGLCDFTLLTFLTWETDGCLSGIRDIGTREGGSCTAWMYKVYSRGGGASPEGSLLSWLYPWSYAGCETELSLCKMSGSRQGSDGKQDKQYRGSLCISSWNCSEPALVLNVLTV